MSSKEILIGMAVTFVIFMLIALQIAAQSRLREHHRVASAKTAKTLLTYLPFFLTAWLWGPWVGYGLYKVGSWSLNGINYCERPANVIPKTPITIDPNKAESP